MEYLERNGLRLAYDRSRGLGEPVALVHGGWDDQASWGRVAAGLALGLRVLSYDRRDHGESTGPPRSRPVRDDASDLAALLEATELYPAHLVAEGYGGAAALRLAVDRPELVRSVCLHEVPFLGLLGPDEPTGMGASPAARLREVCRLAAGGSGEAAARAYLALFGSPEEQWTELDPASQRGLAAGARAWAREMDDPEATRPAAEELRGIDIPVLATVGEASPEFARRVHEGLLATLPNGQAMTLPQVGHFVHRTDPDLFVGVLGTFLLERNVPST